MSMTMAPSYPFLATGGQDMSSVFPELTIKQAARFLRASEGYVDELLDDGIVAFRQENGERLVQQSSLLKYAERREQKYKALEELVQVSEEAGLYEN